MTKTNRTSPTAYAVVHPGMTRYAYGQVVGVIVDDGTGITEADIRAALDITVLDQDYADGAAKAAADHVWCEVDQCRTATLAALRAHAVNDLTRAIARDGITLTHAEADELGESTIAWMRTRLDLRVEDTDRGVVCTSGHQSTETAGDRQEV